MSHDLIIYKGLLLDGEKNNCVARMIYNKQMELKDRFEPVNVVIEGMIP